MTERKTVYKWFFVWDFDKEEKWLNEMAASGWTLCGIGFCRYEFENTEEEYNIRLENHPADEDYIRFMEETGAEYIGRVFQWIYFRRRASLGEFDIFSDIDSRIRHLDRIGKQIPFIAALNLLMAIIGNNAVRWLNVLCGALLMYALGRIHGKKEHLESEHQLFE